MGSTCEKLRTGQDVLSRRGKVIAAGTEGGKIYTVFAKNELSDNLEEPKKTAKVTATVKAENKNYKKNVKEENNLYNLREELISYISEHKSAINVKVVNFVLTGKQKLSNSDKEELKESLISAKDKKFYKEAIEYLTYCGYTIKANNIECDTTKYLMALYFMYRNKMNKDEMLSRLSNRTKSKKFITVETDYEALIILDKLYNNKRKDAKTKIEFLKNYNRLTQKK